MSPPVEWITLTTLIRLRRNDPTKVDPLWHSKYAIVSTWFHPRHRYSLYRYLPVPIGSLVVMLLDQPILLMMMMIVSLVMVLSTVTIPVWDYVLTTFISSKWLWLHYTTWIRFVRANLPMKFMMLQAASHCAGMMMSHIYNIVRERLIEMECRLMEKHVPLTLVEVDEDDDEEEEEEDEEEEDGRGSDMDGKVLSGLTYPNNDNDNDNHETFVRGNDEDSNDDYEDDDDDDASE